ncbi:MAG TPA: hypothetical protein VGD40_13965 [Chryseosolibacter sp.]
MLHFSRGLSALLITLFLASSLYAQDFREGYIVKLAGDTVNGFVAKRKEFCEFKMSEKAEIEKFAPTDLKGFGTKAYRHYQVKTLPVLNGPGQKVFAELIVRGTMNLYRHNDHFYVQKDTGVYFLEPAKKMVNRVPIRSNKFIGVLNSLMADCYQALTKLDYEEEEIAQAIIKYNTCRGGENELMKGKIAPLAVDFMLFAAIDRGKASLHRLEKFSYAKSISVPVGVGMRISFPRQSDKISAHLELQYDKKVFQVYDETTRNGALTRADYIARYSYVKLPVGVQYSFLRPSSTPYIKGGAVRHFALKVSGLVKSETEENGVVTKDTEEYDFSKKSGYGLWAAAGYQKQFGKSFGAFAELRFEQSTVFTYNTPGSTSRLNQLAFYFGIIL